MKTKVVPIVFSTDDNYAIPCRVAIESVVDHIKNKSVLIIILYDEKKLSSENRNMLKSAELYHNRVKIQFKKMDCSFLDGFDENTLLEHISIASMYRLMLPEIMSECDVCLYMDCDMLVLSDITEFLNMDISASYIAGTLATAGSISEAVRFKKDKYICSGMLLMNLKKMREDSLIEIFNHMLREQYKLVDQDMINEVCGKEDRKKLLPVQFGATASMFGESDYINQVYESEYGEEYVNLKKGEIKPVFMHYCGVEKPWNYPELAMAEWWWFYAHRSFSQDECFSLYKKSIDYKNIVSWDYCYKDIIAMKRKHVVVYGFFKTGKAAYYNLKKRGCQICAFCDEDQNKIGQIFDCDIKVMDLEDILETWPDAFFVIASSGKKKIQERLEKFGVNKENIYRYPIKPYGYYISLTNMQKQIVAEQDVVDTNLFE